MGDTKHMYAVVEVHETDIGRIRQGQRASIESPALEKSYQGTVEEIGWLIYKNDVLDLDPRANTDTRVIEVRICLQDSASLLRFTNLQVRVSIDTTAGDQQEDHE